MNKVHCVGELASVEFVLYTHFTAPPHKYEKSNVNAELGKLNYNLSHDLFDL